jgi:hypothetical protein
VDRNSVLSKVRYLQQGFVGITLLARSNNLLGKHITCTSEVVELLAIDFDLLLGRFKLTLQRCRLALVCVSFALNLKLRLFNGLDFAVQRITDLLQDSTTRNTYPPETMYMIERLLLTREILAHSLRSSEISSSLVRISALS